MMSKENVELIRAAFAAFDRGDFDWLVAHCDPDIEIAQPPDMPDPQTYRGREGLREALSSWPEQWDEWSVDVAETYEVGDSQVVSVVHQHMRARELELDQDVVGVFAVEGGLVTRWQMFLSLDQALAAASRS